MIKKSIVYILFTLIFVLLGILLFQVFKEDYKIGIVDSQKVLEEYQGFKEAKDKYELKSQEFSASFEKQRNFYESKSNELQIISEKLSKKERLDRERELEGYKKNLLKLGANIEQKSKAEEEKLIQGVYNKVNDFINRYGEQKGLDAVLGMTTVGNVLYVKETVDVTREVIEGLNKEYLDGVED